MTSSTYTKKPSQMTTAELKAKADADGLQFYRQQMESNPDNPQARYEYESYCHRLGIVPNQEVNRLNSLSRAQLAEEWTAKGQAIEASENDTWRSNNALKWMASQPGYAPTPDNAKKIVAEVESRGLRGSVADYQVVFDYLVKHNEIVPNPQPITPVRLYTEDELRSMPLDQMKATIDQMGREGIL